MTGSLVSPALRDRVRGFATPLATGLGRLGLTPNALTVIGFLGTAAAAVAAAGQAWLAASVLAFVFGVFDLFDGTLARATGRVSAFGAFLDSTLDRAGEAVVYIGLLVGFLALDYWPGAILAATSMAAAFLVSYARAKAESLGFASGTGMVGVGLAPREVRLVVLVLGLFAAGLMPSADRIYCFTSPCPQPVALGPLILTGALGLITVLATATVLQRILHVANQGQAKEG